MTPIGDLRFNDVPGRMRAAAAGRLLAQRAEQHRADGLPQLALFAFDHVGRSVELWGRYEREELTLLMQCLRAHPSAPLAAGGIALDIGANVGNHALFFGEHFDEVYAFEPNPRTHALLALNATLRSNVRCFETALSDRDGKATLTVPTGNLGLATLDAAARGLQGSEVAVRLQRLDALPELAGRRVALIKLDVEGHEAAVLRGARDLLARDRPVVVFEQAAHEIDGGTSATLQLLRAAGYARLWTVQPYPAARSRWLNLALRLLAGQGLRMVESAHLEPRFHSMVVALPGSD